MHSQKTGPGFLVKHKTNGKRGRTYKSDSLINGKVTVHYEIDKCIFMNEGTLVEGYDLLITGFID